MDDGELGDRLADVVRGALGDPTIVVDDLRRLTGGASRETYSFVARGEAVGERALVLQRERPGTPGDGGMATEASLLAAAEVAGVPVAPLVASGTDPDELGAGYLVSGFVEGETIARKILRDDEFATARDDLAAQCGAALAAVHAIPAAAVSGLVSTDEVARYREVLDLYGDPHPAFEVAFAWLEANRPREVGTAVVHGDFRLGNLMVGPDGLRAVVDWELAHLGDPMEDLGWLCVRAWRFGGPGPVAGVGTYDELFAAYEAASGTPVDPEVVRWWEVLGTLKWGIMCITQARAHLDGWTRSMELAAIGRRTIENEHDLLLLLEPAALAAAVDRPEPEPAEVDHTFGSPTAAQLLDAVRAWVADDVRGATSGRVAFHSRVAENVLATVERELHLGPTMRAEHAERLSGLGLTDDAALAERIRTGERSGPDVVRAVAESVVDRLRIANPRWFA